VGYAGGSALPAIYPKMHLQPGASTQWLPDDTKTGGEDGPMEVPVLGGSLCSITQLGLCLAAHEVQHHPITNFITRVLTPDRTGFAEKAISSNDLNTRVQKHMKEAGIYAGHTIHGSRRGSMQYALQNGMSEEEISRKAQIKTPAITRLYLNPFAHLGR
jgi:hypothetical protein